MFSPPAVVPLVLSKFVAEHITGQFRLFILVGPCWIEAPWLPKVLNTLEDIPHCCPIIKILVMDILIDQVLKGLSSLHLIIWLLRDVCCADKGSFLRLTGSGRGYLSMHNNSLPAMFERMGRLVCSVRCCQTMPFVPLN